MPMLASEIDTASGAGANGGRRPTVVPAPDAASPEFCARPRRRTFTAADKLRILADVDRAASVGVIGAVLRREGLYSSTLGEWRRLRDAGALGALTPVRRGLKRDETNPLAAKLALLEKDNARLTLRLARAEAIIDLQKKLRSCWASRWRPAQTRLDRGGRGTRTGQRNPRRHLRGTRGVARHRPSPARSYPRAGGDPRSAAEAGNDAAFAYMREHGLLAASIALLAAAPQTRFADHAAWQSHLDRVGFPALKVTPDPLQIATEAALWGSVQAHEFLCDAVILRA